MTAPKLSREISIGNIVSWLIMAGSLIVAFTKIQAAADQSLNDSATAKAVAYDAQDRLNVLDRARDVQIYEIKTDVAVIKANVLTINEKIDDLKDAIKSKQ